jgi:hypothetical protein
VGQSTYLTYIVITYIPYLQYLTIYISTYNQGS